MGAIIKTYSADVDHPWGQEYSNQKGYDILKIEGYDNELEVDVDRTKYVLKGWATWVMGLREDTSGSKWGIVLYRKHLSHTCPVCGSDDIITVYHAIQRSDGPADDVEGLPGCKDCGWEA